MERTERDGMSLLEWQWQGYAASHQDRTNLAVHVITVPLFLTGTCAVLASPWVGALWAVGGVAAMAAAMAAQGRAHRREESRPTPFRGSLDALVRIFAEQWVTFPRYVLSGDFGRAWRRAAVRLHPRVERARR